MSIKTKRNMKISFTISLISVLFIILGCKCMSNSLRRDMAIDKPSPYNPPKYGKVEIVQQSHYLTMRDGTKLAVEVYLPKETLENNEKIPSIIWMNRYWRAAKFNVMVDWILNKPHPLLRGMVERKYALLSIDVRGSGASFGYEEYCYSKDEIDDSREIVNWIIGQPWSDGIVGSAGISYSGFMAELAATNKLPVFKAAIVAFSLFDAYTDVTFPGGIHSNWFTAQWNLTNTALDQNKMPPYVNPFLKMMVRGVRPVDSDKDASLLKEAIKEHGRNWNVHEAAEQITFIDDVYINNLSIGAISSYNYLDDLKDSGTAFYFCSGWYDGGYSIAAIKRFLNLKDKNNKLLLGPWSHGGFYTCSPTSRGESKFDLLSEALKFFDYHLKGLKTGVYEDKIVHYYTMVEDKWKAADKWPPSDTYINYFLSSNNTLALAPTSADVRPDTYLVDYTHGTGQYSRWNSLIKPIIVKYPDRKLQDEKLLVYDSPPLKADTEVTGHPQVTLYVSSTASDGAFFVYLEDVSPNGDVEYVSEGMLRALHRNISSDTPPYTYIGPYHSFKRKDAQPIEPGSVIKLQFEIFPISYLFRKDHKIRIAIAGADKDHFVLIPSQYPPTIKVFHDAMYQSVIQMPIIKQQEKAL